MKIETVISAKSLWYIELRNINPRGRNLDRIIVPKLQEWYGFTAPTEFDEEKGVKFMGGEFSPSERGDDITGIELTIYNNGIVAMSSTSTLDTETFLERLCSRLSKEGVIHYRPEMVKRKQYSSEVVARSDKQLALPQLDPVYAALSQHVYGGTAKLSCFGLSIDTDPLAPAKQIPFKFEHRATTSFDENLWYSHGPLSTEQHQAILDILEIALSV